MTFHSKNLIKPAMSSQDLNYIFENVGGESVRKKSIAGGKMVVAEEPECIGIVPGNSAGPEDTQPPAFSDNEDKRQLGGS